MITCANYVAAKELVALVIALGGNDAIAATKAFTALTAENTTFAGVMRPLLPSTATAHGTRHPQGWDHPGLTD